MADIDLLDGIKVGDSVRYVPHMCHALFPNAQGDYPWVLGWMRRLQADPGNPSQEPEVLTKGRLREVANYLKNHPDPVNERKRRLVLLRPGASWPAKVVETFDDGTAKLDIESNRSGVTLHYRVPIVPLDKMNKLRSSPITHEEARQLAHTCHREGGTE